MADATFSRNLDLARLTLAAGHPVEARRDLTRLCATTRDDALIDLARQAAISCGIERTGGRPDRHSGTECATPALA